MVRMLLLKVVAQFDNGYRLNGCIYIKVCAIAVWSIYTDNLFMRDMPKRYREYSDGPAASLLYRSHSPFQKDCCV